MIGVQANPGQSAYGATKAGVTLLAFTVFLCSEAASHLSGTLVPIRPIAG